ncbi:MAG: 2-C-methyl-D-erythritol 2,4-cyclodiphosphate synthase [Peptococcaceae bacterium]|nr:2-C-methyl-D-erythritol 2,4-cyclodiphosphate synthase [Peptococcaceae bacterium]
MRIGMGYDVHRLTGNRPLILGGVTVPWPKGLLGHSDADVLTHAVIDALLGAAALGDIGDHFPDTDDRFKNASSLLLLGKVAGLLARLDYKLNNLDCTIVAQEPKMSPYREAIRENYSKVLEVPPGKISVKATTTEGLGFAGRREGIAAYAVCLLSEN